MFRSAPRVLAIIILLVSGSIETAAEENSNVQLLKGKGGIRRVATTRQTRREAATHTAGFARCQQTDGKLC
jgi:hypothetical protein